MIRPTIALAALTIFAKGTIAPNFLLFGGNAGFRQLRIVK